MKANRSQLDAALRSPSNARCFLFHGPDEAGSRALARKVRDAAGKDVEVITLSGSELRGDPARLADEAAALSMFGGARVVIVEPAGDDSLAAATAWIESDVTGCPVVLVAGTLKPTSKLLKLVTGAKDAVAFASYKPDARDLDRLVIEQGRVIGLNIRADVAHRIGLGSSGDRAVIEQELAKFAIYLRARPGQDVDLPHDIVDLLGASLDEGDTSDLIDQLFDGRGGAAEVELARLRGEGVEGITLIRAALRRAILLAKLRPRVEQGESPTAVIEMQGKSVFHKEKPGVTRQLGRWSAAGIARSVERLMQAERDVKASGGIGPLAADAELLAIARQAGRGG